MEITRETVSELYHGHKIVGTTAVQLTTHGTALFKGVVLRALGTNDPTPNTGTIWIGGPRVTNDGAEGRGGIPVYPGDSMFVPIERADLLWLIASAPNQRIAWMSI